MQRVALGFGFVIWMFFAGALGMVWGEARAVVSLTLMTDEFLVELVPASRILALSRDADNPELSNCVEKAQAVRQRVTPQLERLLELHPDLVLAADWTDAGIVEFLGKHQIPVHIVKTPRRWSQVRDRLSELGVVLDAVPRASELLRDLDRREALLKASRPPETKRLTVLEYNAFGSSMSVGTLWADLVELAGLRDAAAGLPVDQYGYAPLSREMLLRLNPDWLVLPTAAGATLFGRGSFLSQLEADPLYQGMRAVREKQVLFLPEALKTTTSLAALHTAEVLQNAAYSHRP